MFHEDILKFYKQNIKRLPKRDNSVLIQNFVYVLPSYLFLFWKTFDVLVNLVIKL